MKQKFQEKSSHITLNTENEYYNNLIVDFRTLQRITFNFVLHTPFVFLDELEGRRPHREILLNQESHETKRVTKEQEEESSIRDPIHVTPQVLVSS